ncbi:hypothetical protein SNEBB_006073 [Seison nebaliae]|nr:hypothetical protein SNEBB_006073 [Seison nebaliae]
MVLRSRTTFTDESCLTSSDDQYEKNKKKSINFLQTNLRTIIFIACIIISCLIIYFVTSNRMTRTQSRDSFDDTFDSSHESVMSVEYYKNRFIHLMQKLNDIDTDLIYFSAANKVKIPKWKQIESMIDWKEQRNIFTINLVEEWITMIEQLDIIYTSANAKTEVIMKFVCSHFIPNLPDKPKSPIILYGIRGQILGYTITSTSPNEINEYFNTTTPKTFIEILNSRNISESSSYLESQLLLKNKWKGIYIESNPRYYRILHAISLPSYVINAAIRSTHENDYAQYRYPGGIGIYQLETDKFIDSNEDEKFWTFIPYLPFSTITYGIKIKELIQESKLMGNGHPYEKVYEAITQKQLYNCGNLNDIDLLIMNVNDGNHRNMSEVFKCSSLIHILMKRTSMLEENFQNEFNDMDFLKEDEKAFWYMSTSLVSSLFKKDEEKNYSEIRDETNNIGVNVDEENIELTGIVNEDDGENDHEHDLNKIYENWDQMTEIDRNDKVIEHNRMYSEYHATHGNHEWKNTKEYN